MVSGHADYINFVCAAENTAALSMRVWKMKRTVLFLLLILCAGNGAGFAATTDEWVGKAANAATTFASGSTEGAVQQMVPSYYVPLTGESGVQAGPSSANFHQQIPGVSQLSTKAFGMSGTYHAGASYGLNRLPTPSQNVQVNAGNQYLSNTTTVSPPLWRDRRDK